MKRRVCIFIDGANFFHGIRTFGNQYSDLYFDFRKYFSELIENDDLIEIYYYNASLIQSYNKNLYWKQHKMFQRLRKINNCNLILCKRKPRMDGFGEKYHIIKGDDVYLTLDMISCAYENKYDKAFLISSDGDFAPLIEKAESLGKKVSVCYFKECVSNDLLNACSSSKKISKSTIKRCFLKND
ncbi:MAG: NYN domain-containing protein [Nanoarchaeota archaeon]|jgi:uncharacterized LabA/DUF88 family protein|nr:NYN domain-containing protein [Nanoarchaeota archaeon]